MTKRDWGLQTERLVIRFAEAKQADIDFLGRLWNDGEVMKFVGFPNGLGIDAERVERLLSKQEGDEYDRVLLACLSDGQIIGECKLGGPTVTSIRKTDIKLATKFWGNGYGREIKKALVNYLFSNTDCTGIEGTPNVKNMASIKMQEAVGAKRIGQETASFPEEMRDYTCDVPHYIYVLSREDWLSRRETGP